MASMDRKAFGRGGFFRGMEGFPDHERDDPRRRHGGRGGPEGPRGRGAHDRGGHDRGGRRRRRFDQSELQLLLLSLIAEQPRHGYDLIREIEALSGGEYAPSPGVVYPALSFMEEQGVIAHSPEETARRPYVATDQGEEQVKARAEEIAAVRARLSALAEKRERTDPAPVRRAMHSVKAAVVDRLSQPAANREVVLRIAEILDDAVRQIERIEA